MNAIGFKTLFWKEVRRFLRVPGQAIAQPVIMTSLYFLIFGYSLGGRIREFEGVPYIRFIVPGLVMLSVIQNSLLNTSSSLFVMKLQGTIVDLLVAPLSTAELLAAFAFAGVARGLLVGTIVWLVAAGFTGFQLAHPIFALAFVLIVSATFALIGLIVAVWSDKFEQLNVVPTFIITPLTFLGGVFYPISTLHAPWNQIVRANPILYMVEGLRYGLIGVASPDPWLGPWVGLGVASAICAAALALAAWMLSTGYKLRN